MEDVPQSSARRDGEVVMFGAVVRETREMW